MTDTLSRPAGIAAAQIGDEAIRVAPMEVSPSRPTDRDMGWGGTWLVPDPAHYEAIDLR